MAERDVNSPVPTPRGGRSRRSLALVLVATLLVGAGVTVGVLYVTGAFSTEIVREPIAEPGGSPFTPTIGEGHPVSAVPSNTGVTVPGDTVGLYGGTLNQAACDPGKLVRFLEQNPDKAAAWAGVLGISPTAIPDYVRDLTPLILRSDTAVTNHGFADGKATTLNSVLQAGTAVLVDRAGIPRVRCACGNPLTPARTYSRPVYSGTSWPKFEPQLVTVIQPSVQIINQFVIINLANNQSTIRRPAGSTGDRDEGRIEDASIAGTYTFQRALQRCDYEKGCHLAGAVLNIRFDCAADACAATLLGGWTQTPHPLTRNGDTYQFSADDPLAAKCNGGPSPGTSIQLAVTVTAAGDVNGVWRATAFKGTYRVTSPAIPGCSTGGAEDALST